MPEIYCSEARCSAARCSGLRRVLLLICRLISWLVKSVAAGTAVRSWAGRFCKSISRLSDSSDGVYAAAGRAIKSAAKARLRKIDRRRLCGMGFLFVERLPESICFSGVKTRYAPRGCHRMGYCRSRWYSRVKKLQSSCPSVVSGLRWRWCCFRRTSSHSNRASNKKERERDKSNIAAPASNGTKHFTSLIILLVYLARQ